jgi:diketogulonate reductase-like aldo/keto reductase
MISHQLGFGTYKLSKDDAYRMVSLALNKGYRLIDTAQLYCNEKMVAKAIEESEVPREDIFLCTKISTKYHGNIEKSVRQRLKIFNYIDLLLLHWPSTEHVKGWEILCRMQRENPDKIKNIGICNVSQSVLEDLMRENKRPDAIQIELNPFCYEKELIEFCQEKDIKVIAHSCLSFGKALTFPEILELSSKHQYTPAKILLRWAKEHANTVLTCCDREEYLTDNMDLDIAYIEVDTDRKERLYYFR